MKYLKVMLRTHAPLFSNLMKDGCKITKSFKIEKQYSTLSWICNKSIYCVNYVANFPTIFVNLNLEIKS